MCCWQLYQIKKNLKTLVFVYNLLILSGKEFDHHDGVFTNIFYTQTL